MKVALVTLGLGAVMLLVARPWSRSIARSQAFWFDRAVDVDGMTWWIRAMGLLLCAFGLVFLVLAL